MDKIRNLSLVIWSDKIIPVEEVDDTVTTGELLNALAQKIDLPKGISGVFIRKKTNKELALNQTLRDNGIEDGETLIAEYENDWERPAFPDIKSNKKQTSSLSVIFGDEIVKNSSIYPNFSQEFIVTTADKVKILLIAFQEAYKAKNDWVTPLGILLALIPTLVAADFKQFLGINPSIWQSIFIISSVICFFWLLRAIYFSIKLREKSEIEYVIEQLKRSSKKVE